MARPIVTRRGLLLSSLAVPAALAACAPQEPPPPPPPQLVVSSAAAIGTVIQSDPAERGVTVRANDGIFSVGAPENSRRGLGYRAGGRVLVVFTENSPPRLAPPGQLNDPARNLVTIQAVNPGATELIVLGPQGGAQTVYVQDPAIAAFLTRVGPGSRASLSFRQVPAGSI